MHGSILEELCVCVALGKEGNCSLTAEHHETPRILNFYGTAGLFKESEEGTKFSFFLNSSGTRLMIHSITDSAKDSVSGYSRVFYVL